MHCQIAVAGVEPCGFAELPHGLQAKKSIAFHSPSAFAAEQPGENVGDGINVGRNVESPPQQVIAGVHDQSDFFGGDNLAQSIDKLCAASAAGEYADHATVSFSAGFWRARAALVFSASNPEPEAIEGMNSL